MAAGFLAYKTGALARLYRFDRLKFTIAAVVAALFGLTVGPLPAVAFGCG